MVSYSGCFRPQALAPRWLAFYQPKNFGEDAYRIRYYGQIKDIRRAKRNEIFPNKITSAKSEREYFILNLAKLEEREVPIPSYRPRRLIFIPTQLLSPTSILSLREGGLCRRRSNLPWVQL